jgi:dienelactone hydrolase
MTAARFLWAALAAAFSLIASEAHAEVRTEWIEYTQGGTKLKGYLAYDDSVKGKRPGVLMVHRRNGMDAMTLKNTEMWANLGYAVFAADIFGYGQGILPKTIPEMEAQSAIYFNDRPLMRARAQAGLDALMKNPMVDASRVALVGYCLGGTVGVDLAYAGAPLSAVVAIHGSFRDHDPAGAKNVKGRFLILHGADDKPAPISVVNEVIEQLRAARIGFQYELYSGANHGFSVPRNPAEERANTQSIAATTRFLREVFAP